MGPGSIWGGPGRFRSSKTMILNGFQLGNSTNLDSMKLDEISIESDPGASQERRKQYAFDFFNLGLWRWVLGVGVVVAVGDWCGMSIGFLVQLFDG